MNWKPGPIQISWARGMVGTMRDGSEWALPMNKTVYRIDKTAKTLTLIEGVMDDIFEKNVLTFAHAGYRVVDGRAKGVS